MNRKDSELFKSLVKVAEGYLREYCDGKQSDDERAKVALRVLSVYRRVLKIEEEREKLKAEWKKLLVNVADLKKFATAKKGKPKKPEPKNPRRCE